MGYGRGDVKANSFIGRDLKNPSPGTYNPQLLKKSESYSLYSRRPDLSDGWIKKVPGPGTYKPLQLTSK